MLDNILGPLAELSRPITKLIDTINSGIYKLYEPTHIRKIAKAKADEMKILAKAKVESLLIESETLRNYALEIEEQKLLLEFRKKENRETIVLKAAESLKGKSVNDVKVDVDWVNQFFTYSENVSNEEMQTIWAKVLAGEVQNPNSYSKRALFTISIMSEHIAKSFVRVGVHSFQNLDGDLILSGWMGNYLRDTFGDYALRTSTSILHGLDLMHVYNFPQNLTFAKKGDTEIHFRMKDGGFKILLEEPLQEDFKVGGQSYTILGKELFPLVGGTGEKKDFIEKYFEMVNQQFQKKGLNAQLQLQ